MDRRDFLKLSAAPAFHPLLNFYPKEVIKELEEGKVASFGNLYIDSHWKVNGPIAVEGIDIVGPHFGHPMLDFDKPDISQFIVDLGGPGFRHAVLHLTVTSDNAFHWRTYPGASIIVAKGEYIAIRRVGGNGILPDWKVFTLYR